MTEKILDLVKRGEYGEARKELINLNAVDIAQLFEEISQEKLLIIFRILPKDLASEVFTYMSSELQQYVIELITDQEWSISDSNR
jgi:magnesium transporter